MTRVAQDFEIWTGVDRNLVYTITDNSGASVDMTSACCRWVLQDEYDSGSLLVYQTAGSGVTVSGCTVTVAVRAEDTAGCALVGDYYTELSASDTSGSADVLAVGTATFHRMAY